MLEQDLKEQGILKNSVEVKLVIRSLRGLPCRGSSGVQGVRTSGERSLIRIILILFVLPCLWSDSEFVLNML